MRLIPYAIFPLIALFFMGPASGQQTVSPSPVQTVSPTASDSTKLIHLVTADLFRMIKKESDSGELNILSGHVVMKQGNTTFYCDSAIQDPRRNSFEAFGNIHINDRDSIHTYSQYLKYTGDNRTAVLKKKVKLTDGKGVLTTEELQYDLGAKIGTYVNGGKVVNKTTTLTSREGYYYADTHEVYFKKEVKLKDPEYRMDTDTLLYSLDQELATFVAPTVINDGKTTIRTKSGFYDLKNGNASFGERPIIEDSSQKIIAENIIYDKKSGKGSATGNVLYRDTAQGVTILAGETLFNNNSNEVLATKKPVMILKQENDSIYISGDTLYSAVKTDTVWKDMDSESFKKQSTDTLKIVSPKVPIQVDSIRFFQAYHHVRIFSDSLQGVCDSLQYSSRDSVFRMFRDPILWSNANQISGDTVYLFTKNKQPDHVQVFENAFAIGRTREGFFNQIKGNTINGSFVDGKMDFIRAKGNAESIYYLQDQDSAYVGMNYSHADAITLYFGENGLRRVSWVNGVEGTSYPLRQIPSDKKELRHFQWLDEKRPKTRLDLFE
jgi:lipopolysaccharide export system protein LptA